MRSTTLLLTVVCAAQFLDGLDVSSMGPALPSIQQDLDVSASDLQWVVSAYVLGYGGFLLLGGRVADLFSRRRAFLASLGVFALASLVGGFASSSEVLIGARFVKGVAAGFTAPAALAILLSSFPEAQARNRALGVFTSTGAAGFTLGLVFGGALAGADWRLTLLMPAALALALVTVAWRVVPADPAAEARGEDDRIDVAGAVSVTAGLMLVVFGVSRAESSGWIASATLLPLVAGLTCLACFVAVEQRQRSPLVPLRIFRKPGLARANGVAFLLQGGYVGFQFVATLYYQRELGWSPLEAGLAFLLGGVLVAALAPTTAKLVARHGAWTFMAAGMLLQIVSYVSFLRLDAAAGIELVLIQQAIGGFGYALVYPAANIAAVAEAGEREEGVASALFIAATQIGSGVVLAAVASAFAAAGPAGLSAYEAGVITTAVSVALGTLVAATGLVGARRPSAA